MRIKKRRGGNVKQTTSVEYHQSGKVHHKTTPSRDWLKANYDYDTNSGKLVRRKDAETGCFSPYSTIQGKAKKRRWVVCIKGEKFKNARLVWAWHHDDPGNFQVDHIDRDTQNDRIENLRLATNSQNNANKNQVAGYSFRNGKFTVVVVKNGKHHWGGTYRHKEDAAKAAAALRKALHGEFADTRLIKPSETLRAKTIAQMPLFD